MPRVATSISVSFLMTSSLCGIVTLRPLMSKAIAMTRLASYNASVIAKAKTPRPTAFGKRGVT